MRLSAVPPCVRRTTEDFATSHHFRSVSQILNLINHHGTPQESSSRAVLRGVLTRGEVAVRCAERNLAFKTKAASFQAVLFAVSLKDKIDAQILYAHGSQARLSARNLRQPIKAGMIFARKTTWRSRLDLEDLDETSSRKFSARQQHNDGPERTRPLRQFANYASKETLGQVHAGGFLHHMILINKDGAAPPLLSPDAGSDPVLRLAGLPGRWRTSCAASPSPGAPVRARHSARLTQSPIRFFRKFRTGTAFVSTKRTLLGNPRGNGFALQARRRPCPPANPASREKMRCGDPSTRSISRAIRTFPLPPMGR